jgi:ADP-ribosyl-[dinitrogen reductase] hydrolase
MGTGALGPDLAERYAGCLLGLACGDALGGPVEFKSRAEITRDFPDGVREFVGGGWLRLAPGEVTDDTQMTLALAEGLGPDGLDMEKVAAAFLAWYRSNPKDIGSTTRKALEKLAAGQSWEEAGEAVQREALPEGVGANGSVMRCAPVALRFRRDRAALVHASIDSARITHADPRCTWGAVAVNQAIVHLLEGGPVRDVARAAADGIDERRVRETLRHAPTLTADIVRGNGYVLNTISAATWCLTNRPSYEEAVVTAVGLGEDPDTTAAVTGALAGAAYGTRAIPERWLNRLHRRNELEALAARLLGWAG